MVSVQDIKAQLTGVKRYGSGLVGVFGEYTSRHNTIEL